MAHTLLGSYTYNGAKKTVNPLLFIQIYIPLIRALSTVKLQEDCMALSFLIGRMSSCFLTK
jgi:hypothetical protein